MLALSQVNKTYANGVQALANVSLTIGKGMFGLLGPNGAGKSTLMRTLATLQVPDSGSLTFEGIDIVQEKERIRTLLGYLPQEFGVYPSVSAEVLLDHLALLKGISDGPTRRKTVHYLLELTNLIQHRKKKLGAYSGGMKQRFGIAQALLGQPRLIIVDEPTAGLDPEERDRFHNFLSQISENVTVILSTHIVSDVSNLCQDLAIMNNGQILLHKAPRLAIQELEGRVWGKIIQPSELEICNSRYKVIASRLTHGQIMVRVYGEDLTGDGFSRARPDLEDAYFCCIRFYVR